MVTNSRVLAYYDPNEELILENDASEYGIGSALFQDGKPVAYTRRSLTDSDSRYAQIEQMLAVSFGREKFHDYTYGRQIGELSGCELGSAVLDNCVRDTMSGKVMLHFCDDRWRSFFR